MAPRHKQQRQGAPPNPMGCRWCGIDQRPHAIQAGTHTTHTWTPPTQQQIKDRMLARRARRNP